MQQTTIVDAPAPEQKIEIVLAIAVLSGRGLLATYILFLRVGILRLLKSAGFVRVCLPEGLARVGGKTHGAQCAASPKVPECRHYSPPPGDT